MDCRTAIEVIARARAGALAPAERQDLDEHAATCARCRAEEALSVAIESALVAEHEPAPGDDFTRRVLARIRAAERPCPAPARAPSWPARLLVRAAPTAAIAATFAGVAVLGPVADGTALLDFLGFFGRSLPHLSPATWMSLLAGVGLAVLGTYQTATFFAES